MIRNLQLMDAWLNTVLKMANQALPSLLDADCGAARGDLFALVMESRDK